MTDLPPTAPDIYALPERSEIQEWFDEVEKPTRDMPLVPLAVALIVGLVFWLAVGLSVWWAL